jgi:hypothetical protein
VRKRRILEGPAGEEVLPVLDRRLRGGAREEGMLMEEDIVEGPVYHYTKLTCSHADGMVGSKGGGEMRRRRRGRPWYVHGNMVL